MTASQSRHPLRWPILSDSTALAYTVHPGRGPYLLLLHGFLSSARQWQDNLAALAQVCTPITVDLYGHGHSPAPDAVYAYTPAAYIDALEQIRQQLGAQHWFVGGYSLGAGLTIRYAHSRPQHVLAHLFTNSTSAFADAQQVAQWRADADESAARILRDGAQAIRRIPVHPRFAKRLPPGVAAALAEDAHHLSPQGIANTLLGTTPNACIRDIAPTNPRPALLCYGQHEKRFAPLRDWAEQHMSRLEITTLAAGHAVNMEDPTGFNQAVVNFLLRHQP